MYTRSKNSQKCILHVLYKRRILSIRKLLEIMVRKIILKLKDGICTDTDLDCTYDMNSFGFKLNSFLSCRPGGDPHY